MTNRPDTIPAGTVVTVSLPDGRVHTVKFVEEARPFAPAMADSVLVDGRAGQAGEMMPPTVEPAFILALACVAVDG